MIIKDYTTIKVSLERIALTIQLNQPHIHNGINALLIDEMMEVLSVAEQQPEIKCIILEGLPDIFCTGMDFESISDENAISLFRKHADNYFGMLSHLTLCSKVVIAKVEGKAHAGGVGLVAASDIVIASEHALFALPEAIFGLLPACVMPFLIRRIGHQKAQWMSLITREMSADKAFQIGLVDEVSKSPADAVRKCLLRINRLEINTIKELKNYTSELCPISENIRQLAVDKISSLALSEKVQQNIMNFLVTGKLI